MIYCGNSGIGKTNLCASLMEWALKTFGHNFRYWTENALLKRLRDSMDSMKGDYLDALQFLIDSELLILDDVGSSVKVNEWREEIFFSIVDARYNSLLPTIITSNFTEKEFLQKYHARVHSRLFAKENTIIEITDGIDYRLMGFEEDGFKFQKPENS